MENVSRDMIRGESSKYNWPSSSEIAPDSFMGRLQARTGFGFDLPTEAQWEYACRAGTTSKYNNGDDSKYSMKQLGRCFDNPNDGRGRYLEHTTVGSYKPNAWGLYDMHGNIEEMCLDWYASDLLNHAVDPIGPPSGEKRVSRGCSWINPANFCSSSFRSTTSLSYRLYNVGFRVTRTLPK